MRLCLSIAVPLLLGACTPDRVLPVAADSDCCSVRILISVPAATGNVYLTGNRPEFGPWSPGLYRMQTRGNERIAELRLPAGTKFEYKVTLGSWNHEAVHTDGRVLPNFELTVMGDQVVRHTIERFKPDPIVFIEDSRGSGVQGTLIYWTDVASEFLGPTRHVSIWLPPGYDVDRQAGYPVLYMHDGQALFDPRLGGMRGDIWDVDDAIVNLVERDEIPPIIVVGVWNSDERMVEYSPWHGAPDYARFLIEELIPRVNAGFNTATGAENTAVMGSSMGGLLSYYLVTFHPESFGSCGCVSSAFILSEAIMTQWAPPLEDGREPDDTPYIVRDIESGLRAPGGVRYWFDHGTMGGDEGYDVSHIAVRKWLLEQGLVEERDFVVRVYEGADHNEAAWRTRLEDPLRFLFGEP